MPMNKPAGPRQTSSQKAQKTQAGGPTIGGVAGIGKQKMVTRPRSAQRPTIVHAHHTGPSASGLGEGKENEFTANRQLHSTVRGKINSKLTNSSNDYFSHNDRATSKPVPTSKVSGMSAYTSYNSKKTMKEDAPAMSVAGGGVSPVAPPDATAAYALQKKMREKLARRKQTK